MPRQQTKTKQNTAKNQLDDQYDAVHSLIADEAFGSRDVEDLGRDIVLDNHLNEQQLERLLELAKERAFYLDRDQYQPIIDKLEQVLDQ